MLLTGMPMADYPAYRDLYSSKFSKLEEANAPAVTARAAQLSSSSGESSGGDDSPDGTPLPPSLYAAAPAAPGSRPRSLEGLFFSPLAGCHCTDPHPGAGYAAAGAWAPPEQPEASAGAEAFAVSAALGFTWGDGDDNDWADSGLSGGEGETGGGGRGGTEQQAAAGAHVAEDAPVSGAAPGAETEAPAEHGTTVDIEEEGWYL